jgi:very-short-patch-repair endonuclease
MQPKSSGRSPDAVISRLAAKQNGVVYREQLLEAGLTSMQIRTRISDGRLMAIHRGVYLVGAVAPEWAYAQAALFACGSESVLFARSAIAVWNLGAYPSLAYPWVLVPPHRRIERPRIVVHQASLSANDVRNRYGLRVTSPPRTVFDMARFTIDADELEALVAEAHFRGLAREPELRDQMERNPGARGVAILRSVLDIEGGPQRTRSDGERALLRLLREHGINGFRCNDVVHGREVDFFWRDLDFCVELDGWDAHSSRQAFERDRLKWAELDSKGVDVMPVTGRQIELDKKGVVSRLRAALDRRR